MAKYGWKRDLPDQRDYQLSLEGVDVATLPELVDLRPGMPVIWDQGQLGSCTAHAIGAAAEYDQKKRHPNWDFMPARLFIYYNERLVEGTVGSDSGASIRDGVKVLNKYGVCKETLWPYDIAKFAKKPTAVCYKNGLIHQSLKYTSVPQTEVGIKSVLASGLPVIIGFTVYESFESEEVAKTGIVPMPAKREQVLGGHAVLVVGYDTAKKMYLVRNSWGEGWGLAGYFYMPEAYLYNPNLSDDFWVVNSME